MVLSVEQLAVAEVSSNWRVRNMLVSRRKTANFTEQCCIDREIQWHISAQTSPAYKFNCHVIHTAVKFTQVTLLLLLLLFSSLASHEIAQSSTTIH
jgi:hypothetical protein